MTVSFFEMLSSADFRPKFSEDQAFVVRPVSEPQWQLNKFCFHLVGADWRWFSRAFWSDAEWQAYATDPRVRTFTAFHGGSVAGYFELWREDGVVEIKFIGLAPQFIGRGLGAHLLSVALEEAWRANPRRVWLHTCDWDHPSAKSNYLARGMRLYKVERQPESTGPSLGWRSATESDVPLLATWNHQLIRDEGHRNPMDIAQLGRRLQGWFANGDYVATVFNAPDPIGYALHQVRGDSIYLRQFFIRPQSRRQGLGRAAFQCLRDEVWPRERRITVEVLSGNRAGTAFWRAVGFRDYCLTLEVVA